MDDVFNEYKTQEDEKAWYDFQAIREKGDRRAYCTAWWVFVKARQQVALEEEVARAERAAGWSATP